MRQEIDKIEYRDLKGSIAGMDMQELRENVDLSRTEVAYKLGVSETSVRNWERGRTEPTMTPQKYLEALNLFRCTPEQLAEASKKSINQEHKGKPGRPKRNVKNETGNQKSSVAES